MTFFEDSRKCYSGDFVAFSESSLSLVVLVDGPSVQWSRTAASIVLIGSVAVSKPLSDSI